VYDKDPLDLREMHASRARTEQLQAALDVADELTLRTGDTQLEELSRFVKGSLEKHQEAAGWLDALTAESGCSSNIVTKLAALTEELPDISDFVVPQQTAEQGTQATSTRRDASLEFKAAASDGTILDHFCRPRTVLDPPRDDRRILLTAREWDAVERRCEALLELAMRQEPQFAEEQVPCKLPRRGKKKKAAKAAQKAAPLHALATVAMPNPGLDSKRLLRKVAHGKQMALPGAPYCAQIRFPDMVFDDFVRRDAVEDLPLFLARCFGASATRDQAAHELVRGGPSEAADDEDGSTTCRVFLRLCQLASGVSDASCRRALQALGRARAQEDEGFWRREMQLPKSPPWARYPDKWCHWTPRRPILVLDALCDGFELLQVQQVAAFVRLGRRRHQDFKYPPNLHAAVNAIAGFELPETLVFGLYAASLVHGSLDPAGLAVRLLRANVSLHRLQAAYAVLPYCRHFVACMPQGGRRRGRRRR